MRLPVSGAVFSIATNVERLMQCKWLFEFNYETQFLN